MNEVVEIAKLSEKKNKVVLSSGDILPLYKSEIRKYNLYVGTIVEKELLFDINNNVLYPRAKNRALYIITRSAKTKKQLTDKLKESYYSDETIACVMNFLEKYNYINDYEFSVNYLRQGINNKGMNRMKQELLYKGVSSSVINRAVEECNLDENDSLKKIIFEKKSKYDLNDKKDLNRFIAYLMRRGFSYSDIRKSIFGIY